MKCLCFSTSLGIVLAVVSAAQVSGQDRNDLLKDPDRIAEIDDLVTYRKFPRTYAPGLTAIPFAFAQVTASR